jgi:hypothetical protein
VLKHEKHSHHQVERYEVLPQRIASWVDSGIAVHIYYIVCMYYARDRALEVGIPIPPSMEVM